MVGIAISLALSLGLHQAPKAEAGMNAQLYERTFYTAIVLDVLLAATTGHTTLIKESDYSLAISDNTYGAEEWELWRPMPSEALRVAHSVTTSSGDALSVYRHLSLHPKINTSTSGAGVVRSCALSCFTELVKLCQIGAKLVNVLNGSGSSSAALGQYLRELEQWARVLPAHLSLARAYGLGGTDDQALPPSQSAELRIGSALICRESRSCLESPSATSDSDHSLHTAKRPYNVFRASLPLRIWREQYSVDLSLIATLLSSSAVLRIHCDHDSYNAGQLTTSYACFHRDSESLLFSLHHA